MGCTQQSSRQEALSKVDLGPAGHAGQQRRACTGHRPCTAWQPEALLPTPVHLILAHAPAGVAQAGGRVVLDVNRPHNGGGGRHAWHTALWHLLRAHMAARAGWAMHLVTGLLTRLDCCLSASNAASAALPSPRFVGCRLSCRRGNSSSSSNNHTLRHAPGTAGPGTGSSRVESAPPAARRTQPHPAVPERHEQVWGRALGTPMAAQAHRWHWHGKELEPGTCSRMWSRLRAAQQVRSCHGLHSLSHLWLLHPGRVPPCFHGRCRSRHLPVNTGSMGHGQGDGDAAAKLSTPPACCAL